MQMILYFILTLGVCLRFLVLSDFTGVVNADFDLEIYENFRDF